MSTIARILDSNQQYVADYVAVESRYPARHLAIATCMDSRIDVFAALGLTLGDAHVLRNAGARVTDDLLRSLALSVRTMGTDTVVLMQHTGCGLEGVTAAELREATGTDIDFLPIADHGDAIRADIELLAGAPVLEPVHTIAGLLFDIATGTVEELARWSRS
jgi:carbonic anhydrase